MTLIETPKSNNAHAKFNSPMGQGKEKLLGFSHFLGKLN